MNRYATGLFAGAAAMAAFAPSAQAELVMDWDASVWGGGIVDEWGGGMDSDDEGWIDLVNGVIAYPGGTLDADGAGPQLGSTAGGVDYITFTNDSFDVLDTTHPLAGLQEFSIATVMRFPDQDAPDVVEDNFWQWNGITGVELPNPGVGDWALGLVDLDADGGAQIGGGTGLPGGDVGTVNGDIDDGQWHTIHFVVDNLDGTNLTQTLYVDGVAVASDTAEYGGVTVVAESAFGIGARFTGENGFLQNGDMARLQFDSAALSAEVVAAQAATFLGEPIPEPTSLALLGLGGLGLITRRRRA